MNAIEMLLVLMLAGEPKKDLLPQIFKAAPKTAQKKTPQRPKREERAKPKSP